jgi:LPS-assembly protein
MGEAWIIDSTNGLAADPPGLHRTLLPCARLRVMSNDPIQTQSEPRQRLKPHALAHAAAALCAAWGAGWSPLGAWAQTAPAVDPPLRLQLDPTWSNLPRAASGQGSPVFVRAKRVDLTPGKALSATGDVEFRQGGLVLTADQLNYQKAGNDDNILRASGHVNIIRDGAVYSGPELQVNVKDFKGWFESPRFEFPQLGAGGRAERMEFLGGSRARAIEAQYSSCPRGDAAEPAWQLSARSVELDVQGNEGIADGAVLRFLGVPILAAPALSFPISDQRKSGWLPPNLDLDNRSGVDLSVPFYWNLAPNRDATITPRVLTRRGVGADLEFRYLEPRHEGLIGVDALPYDRVAERSRHALRAQHLTQWNSSDGWLAGSEFSLKAARVSDDDWWKDFPRRTESLTPRLLAQNASFERPLQWAVPGGVLDGAFYGRLAHWQVLQSSAASDAILSPYQRSPQLGLRLGTTVGPGLEWSLETELNRFTLARRDLGDAFRPEGSRWHATGVLARPWRGAGWWVKPALNLHAAAYHTTHDASGRARASLALPTVSVDAGATFERQTQIFGRALRQVLEPRVHFVRTPYRDQSLLPNYDSAAKDFNITSIFADNAWSGIDRVSDSHQLTLGATTRLVNADDGAELLRLGLVQRVLLSPERVTPDDQQPSEIAAQPLTRKLSDLLLLGSTQVVPRWTLAGTLRFNADTQRATRSVLSARYNAPDFRTLSASYRYTRGLTEQVDLGWQWPLSSPVPAATNSAVSGCGGRLFGVGRVNYSMLDKRVTDSLLGLEYDAGCWIGRVVAERLSTGRSEATTRLMVQLELVGLSRIGSNPLRRLKENIPGYRLLRDERGDSPSMRPSHD